MAKITFTTGEEYSLKLSKLGDYSENIVKRALKEGSKIAADEIRRRLTALGTEKFRYLRDGKKFKGPSKSQIKDLADSFGISPVKLRKDGVWDVRIGFDGYGSFPTHQYPNGVPNILLARSIESGFSVRRKRPFIRPAMEAKETEIIAAMERVIDEEIEKIMKG